MSPPDEPWQRTRRLLRFAAYWLLVLVVSLVLVILLLGFFESRDASEVGAAGGAYVSSCPGDSSRSAAAWTRLGPLAADRPLRGSEMTDGVRARYAT